MAAWVIFIIVAIGIIAFLSLGGLKQLSSVGKGLSSKISNGSQTGSGNTIHGDMSKGDSSLTQSRADAIDSGSLMQSDKVLVTPPSSQTYSNAINANNVRSAYEKNTNYFQSLETPSSDSHVDSGGFDKRAAAISKSLDYSTSLKGSEISLGSSFGRDSTLEIEEKTIEAKRSQAIAESLYGSSVDHTKAGFDYIDPKTGRVI